jgi:hypothetical protein
MKHGVTNLVGRDEATGATLDPPERLESRFAHIGRGNGSWICLCGYRAVRRATPEEARTADYCVVCAELYEGQYGRPPRPAEDERLGGDEQLRLGRDFHRDGVPARSFKPHGEKA